MRREREMKIERNVIPRMTIDEFADQHGLIMEVHERGPVGSNTAFYAHFKNCDVHDGPCLVGTFGDGSTEDEAISHYAKTISQKVLVIDAGHDCRRDIVAPLFIERKDG